MPEHFKNPHFADLTRLLFPIIAYAKPEQVTAPGMRQSVAAAITDTPYRAEASPERPFYGVPQPVVVTGRALSNTAQSVAVPNVPVRLGISVRGFDRFYTVMTDGTGAFRYTFTPGPTEAGTYTVWAVHPDVTTRAVQSTFTIAGLRMSPSTADIRVVRNAPFDIPVTITNASETELTGVTYAVDAAAGITADLLAKPTALQPNQRVTTALRVTGTGDSGYASLVVAARGATGVTDTVTARLDATVTVITAIPVIAVSPSFIDTGLVRGGQRIASFAIKNTGADTLRGAALQPPSTPWMQLITETAIGDIAPGETKTVAVALNVSDAVAQGVYDDRVVITAVNHIPYTYHIQVTVTSANTGSAFFDVMNELMQKTATATITAQHQSIPELIYTVKTDALGTVMLADIPEGRYSYNVTPPPGHKGFSSSFTISPGLVTTVPVALEITMVAVEWSVVPVIIEDRYEIKVTQTFETNVPTPVLILDPPNMNLPPLRPGQVFNGEFKVTNHGLIEVYDVNLDFPKTFQDYDIEVLTNILPGTIGAMQSITVPYKITRRATAAVSAATLYDAIKGYGGSSCLQGLTIQLKGKCVICPNTAQQRIVEKIANFLLSLISGDCPQENFGGWGATGGGDGGGVYTGVMQQVQVSSSSTPAVPSAIKTGNPCECKNGCEKLCEDKIDTFCIGGNCTKLPACKDCQGEGKVIDLPDGGRSRHGDTCCYGGEEQPLHPIADLDKCPKRVPYPGHVKTENGCSIVPDNPMYQSHRDDYDYLLFHGNNDGNFSPACKDHDYCYDECNSSKTTCDNYFELSMENICRMNYAYGGPNDQTYYTECLFFAKTYSNWVKLFARSEFEDAQKEACQCCP